MPTLESERSPQKAHATEPAFCFHCGLPAEGAPVIAEVKAQPRNFCCLGCSAVCQAIFESGLEGFYSRTPDEIRLAPPPEPTRDAELFDLEEMQSGIVQQEGTQCRARLLIEGMHCAACVWLIETSLAKLAGIDSVQVNLTNRQLQVSWQSNQIALSTIMGHLSRIGYAAVPFDPDKNDSKLGSQNRDLLYRMGVAGFAMMNLLWISIALYAGASTGEFRILFHWVGLSLATPVLIYSGYPFFSGALRGLKMAKLTMDLPIAIGASITWGYSVYVTLAQPAVGEVYFDTLVNFLFVILVGRYLEAIARRKAVGASQRLTELQPRGAFLLTNGKPRLVPIRAIKSGDLVLVKPGDTIPVDGIVTDGESGVDESLLSGESSTVKIAPGAKVSAGTLNTWGALTICTQDTLDESTLGQIVQLVEQAQMSRAPIQQTADRVVPWFVAITLGLAAITFFYWLGNGVELALMSATAVLIITCPCALGLATPMAIAVASGVGARLGTLIKTGAVLESFASISTYIFDKTGTLTTGESEIVSLRFDSDKWSINGGGELPAGAILSLSQLTAAEQLSQHPVASALTAFCKTHKIGFDGFEISDFRQQPGSGIYARVNGKPLFAGNLDWLQSQGIDVPSELIADAEQAMQIGCTPLYCATTDAPLMVIGIGQTPREGAKALIDSLKESGIETIMLSGDRPEVAQALATSLGGMQVIAGVRPDGKDRVIHDLQHSGKAVAMIGDGINDAPALVRADVGIALGCGTDVSVDSADIVLMHDRLDSIAQVSTLSRRTIKAIRQNIGISLLYNLIMVPLAMAAIVTPLVAAIAMPISSLLVITNAARINRDFK